jgi:hypothetical protein
MCSTVCDYTLLIKYLFATWCGRVLLDCSYVLLWTDTVVFYWMALLWLPWRLSPVLEMITSQMDSQYADGQTFSPWKMVQDNHSFRTYVQIRRIFLVANGVASDICWNSYSSRTYVRIRRMVLVSLYGVSELFSIMSDYLDGVWPKWCATCRITQMEYSVESWIT